MYVVGGVRNRRGLSCAGGDWPCKRGKGGTGLIATRPFASEPAVEQQPWRRTLPFPRSDLVVEFELREMMDNIVEVQTV